MKTLQFLLLSACCALFFSSCQKESGKSTAIRADESINGASTNTDALINVMKNIDPNNFVRKIDNPYLPWIPGTTFIYKNVIIEDGNQQVEIDTVYVTHDTKLILGVECRVVHDFVSRAGKRTEDTYDWYAQDKDGNVWYFGEDSKDFQHGQWVSEGSWEAGVDGAEPGIVMWAHPEDHIGEAYRQEYLKDVAEDKATVLSANSTVAILMGTFKHCVVTQEKTRLEPDVRETKSYAPGIGNISTVMNEGGSEHEELVKIINN